MQSMTANDVPVAIKDENVEVRMAEVGDMTVSFIRLAAGEAFYWAPGHAPAAVTDCAYVDFSPTEQFARRPVRGTDR